MNIDVTSAESQPISSRSPGRARARAAGGAILERLKLETAADHAAIEDAAGIMSPRLTLQEYRAYLERSFSFYRIVEEQFRQLGVWEALNLAAVEREKLPLLAEDLVLLGNLEPELLQARAAPPRFASTFEAAGGAYVLEGSTLGGRVISRHVQRLFGPDVPRAFLDCYEAQTAERWQSFRAALTRFASSRDIEDRLVAGAQQTFQSFTRWLKS